MMVVTTAVAMATKRMPKKPTKPNRQGEGGGDVKTKPVPVTKGGGWTTLHTILVCVIVLCVVLAIVLFKKPTPAPVTPTAPPTPSSTPSPQTQEKGKKRRRKRKTAKSAVVLLLMLGVSWGWGVYAEGYKSPIPEVATAQLQQFIASNVHKDLNQEQRQAVDNAAIEVVATNRRMGTVAGDEKEGNYPSEYLKFLVTVIPRRHWSSSVKILSLSEAKTAKKELKQNTWRTS